MEFDLLWTDQPDDEFFRSAPRALKATEDHASDREFGERVACGGCESPARDFDRAWTADGDRGDSAAARRREDGKKRGLAHA